MLPFTDVVHSPSSLLSFRIFTKYFLQMLWFSCSGVISEQAGLNREGLGQPPPAVQKALKGVRWWPAP